MDKRRIVFYILIFAMVILSAGCKKNLTLFAGGFTEGDAPGFSVFGFDPGTGSLEIKSEYDAGPSPSYFCFSGKSNLIYCLNEVMEFGGQKGGGLTTLRYDNKNRTCEKVSGITVPYGGPCYISLTADGSFLLLASYGSGSIAVVKLDGEGIPEKVAYSILYVPDSSNVSHPHMIQQDPAGKHVYVTDLGLDRIMIYDLDDGSGILTLKESGTVDIEKGSGPRHFVFNAEGTKMYLINELGSTMMVFDVDDSGGLALKQTLTTLGEGFQGKSYCADVHISSDGKFLYGSNRGENTIVIYKINSDGSLSLAGRSVCGGSWPRNFVIDPSGKYLLSGNQRSDDISVFRLDRETGLPEGPVANAKMNGVACLKFLP